MDPRKLAIVLMLAASYAGAAEMSNAPANANVSGAASLPDSSLALSQNTSLLEDGKALYENGQMIAALGKFMTVLRKDPHNAEARQYLRMIIDIMRQNPAITASKLGSQEQAVVSNPAVQEEIRRMIQLRSRLTMDLKAIPSLQIMMKGNMNQVWINSDFLFAEKSGGLKEQGVPVLDRVAAWLRTYGQQPVIIHCYPEELQDATANGSLFLHRYSELFHFFVDEKKLPAQRFVSADLLKTGDGASAEDVSLSTGPARVVIETIGSQSAMLEESLPSENSTRALSQWLEDSITPNRKTFNPEEGEWVNLDIAAISRMGLRNWTFTIAPAEVKNAKPVFAMDGKGNLLKRVSWDGHDQKTGDFVRAGAYTAKLLAVNGDGTIKTQEEALQVERTTVDQAVLVEKPSKKKSPKKTRTAAVVPKAAVSVPAPVSPPSAAAAHDSDSLVDSKPVAKTPPVAAPPTAEDSQDSGDSAHTIWKQVIQFEPGESEPKPTVKASLERIGKTLEVYPLQKVRITGFAMTSEPNAAELARKRAEAVRTILIEEYSVDKQRVIVAGGKTTSDDNASKVEMSITN